MQETGPEGGLGGCEGLCVRGWAGQIEPGAH